MLPKRKTDKQENAEKKARVGILRKRDTTATSSSAASSIRGDIVTRLKVKPLIKPHVDEGGSLFSKRTKMIRDKPTTVPLISKLQKSSLSASHSTTTLDSHATSMSRISLVSHTPEHGPAYLRNKPGTASKNLVAVQVQCYKKQFNQIKKDLTDIQKKAVECYKRYSESLSKLNKLNGKNEVLAIGELKIVDFIENSANSPPAVESSTPNPLSPMGPNISFTKLKRITNEGVLNQIAEQVQCVQAYSFKLLQEFSDRLSEINNQMKMSETTESGDTNLFPGKIQNLFEEIEKKILDEEIQQNSRINGFMENLKQVMINEEGTPVLMKDDIPEEYENIKKANQLKITELENKIKELELKKTHEERINGELAKSIANEKACRDEKEKEMEHLTQRLKQSESNNKRNEKMLEAKTNEIAIKDKSITELKAIVKSTQDKLIKVTTQSQKLETKISRTEEESQSLINQLKLKHEEETKLCNQLRKEINELRAKAADEAKPLRDENERLKNSERSLEEEIYNLKISLTEVMRGKAFPDQGNSANTDEQVIRREMDRMEDELKRMKSTIHEQQDEMNNRELQMMKKTRDIAELETLIKQLEQRDKENEYQDEISKLQDLNNQKTKENEQLKNELSKALTELHLQEESIFMQQRLLKIRTELIQSLQENEEASKIQLADEYDEIGKKSYMGGNQPLSIEASSKTEEIENLFSTLNARNLEVKRQDHIIKLLEETHERNQRIRVKQEEKIARLENENVDLKRFMYSSKYKG